MANRFTNQNISSLFSDQGISPGLSLGGTLNGGGGGQRTFASLQGYPAHVPHMAAIQDSHIQGIAAAATYKQLTPGQPSVFPDPYAGLRISSHQTNVPASKPAFQDIVSQNTTIDTQKWGLSNFMSQNTGMIVSPTEFNSGDFQAAVLAGQTLLNPPPAHTSKPSILNQRLPFTGMEIPRFPKQPGSHGQYESGGHFAVTSHQYPGSVERKPELLNAGMNYEAVSPASTPGPDASLLSQDQYLSLQDLASISSTQHKLKVSSPQVIHHSPSPMIPLRQSKVQEKNMKGSQQDMYDSKESQHMSPAVGSPPLQIASPHPGLPSSSIGQQQPPLPIQAPADSTTKPKKSRPRKKKDPQPTEVKNVSINQTFNSEVVLNSTDIPQRQNPSDFIQQEYNHINRMMPNLNAYNSAVNVSVQNQETVVTNVNNSFSKSLAQQPSAYAKCVPSSAVLGSVGRMPGQPSVAFPLADNQQPSVTYTVSDALEMSRQAVFAGSGVLDGLNSDINTYSMQDSFSNQLGIDNMRRQEVLNSCSEEGGYMNSLYGGQFVSPNNVLQMDVAGGQSTTIDQDAFSTLMNDSYDPKSVAQESSQSNDAAYSLTVNIEACEDDDLAHLAGPVSVTQGISSKAVPHQSAPVPPVSSAPQPTNTSQRNSFMDSFLSFIQGKKPETLSSMSSAIIQNKPQLPKYVPEPPRPKRVEPVIEPVKPTTANVSISQPTKQPVNAQAQSNENVKFSTSKSGGLTMKINLNKVKKAEESAKRHKQKKAAKAHSKKEKKFGLKEEYKVDMDMMDVDAPPARPSASRRAKEVSGKYTVASDSDSDTLKPIRPAGRASDSEAYDSDQDPAWTPFSVDSKKPAVQELGQKRKRSVGKSNRLGVKTCRTESGEGSDVVDLDSEEDSGDLQVGAFVMDKKDEKNTECYPIWRIEHGRMLHKFELFTENTRILHKSIPTFSSWLPSMRNNFKYVRVSPVLKQGDKEYVEVLEEYRPKTQLDSRLEERYEEHPLVNAFNVYLQTFLSQALEPGFLTAIQQSNERFHLDALDKIDKACQLRINEIDTQVRWRDKFKDALRLRPHIREVDRPNLRQSCQACELISEPAVKSVHLFGNPYDRFSLQEMTEEGSQAPQEFMIGKTAAKFVKAYHNLYHFKHNLFKRCQAKVNILQDGHNGDNAAILDQCLHNRTWVLQLFEDLKQMLENG